MTGLQSNLTASNVRGSLNVTTGAVPALSIATGSGANTINAGAFTQGEALTLIGSSSASVTVGGNLSASVYSGKLSVTASGSPPHSITTGSGKDFITAPNGGDTLIGGPEATASMSRVIPPLTPSLTKRRAINEYLQRTRYHCGIQRHRQRGRIQRCHRSLGCFRYLQRPRLTDEVQPNGCCA